MNGLRQCLWVTAIGLRSWPRRAIPSTVVIVGTACVVATLVSILSVQAGMLRMMETTATPDTALVLSSKTPNVHAADITPSELGTILDAPGIAHTSTGKALADAELLYEIFPETGFRFSHLSIQGIGARGPTLQKDFTIVEGRLFKTGRHEFVVGKTARDVFGVAAGSSVTMPDGRWPIVGVFTAAGGAIQSGLVTDAETLRASTHKLGYGSILVRLNSAADFDRFKQWLLHNPALQVTAERQSEYWQKQGLGPFYAHLGYLVAAVLSIGAFAGAVNILYGVVSDRRREICILRAIGYSPLPIAISVVAEALLVSSAGACVGLGLAWLIANGHRITTYTGIFSAFLAPHLIAMAVIWALAIAILGAIPPAIRAARGSVSSGIQAG